MTTRMGILAALTALAPGVGLAQDAAMGQELAEEHCARCHDIADGGAMKTYPPSFDSISVYRSRDQIYARILFPMMHTGMPAWSTWLDTGQVEDLTAYIMSLEGE